MLSVALLQLQYLCNASLTLLRSSINSALGTRNVLLFVQHDRSDLDSSSNALPLALIVSSVSEQPPTALMMTAKHADYALSLNGNDAIAAIWSDGSSFNSQVSSPANSRVD